MTIELTILGWTLVLAIFQIALASTASARRNGCAIVTCPRSGSTLSRCRRKVLIQEKM